MWVKDNVPGLPARLKGASIEVSNIYHHLLTSRVPEPIGYCTLQRSIRWMRPPRGSSEASWRGRVEMRRVSFSSLNDFRSYRLRQKFRSFAPHRVIYPENTRHPRRSKSRTLLFSIESVLCPSGVTPVGCKRPGWTSGRPYTSPLTHPTCDDNPICLLRMGDAH